MQFVGPTQKLTWDYPVPIQAEGFRVYANGERVWQGVDLVAPLSEMNLDSGTEYAVVVKAYHSVGESEASNQINFTYAAAPPSAPTNLRVIP